METIYDFLSCVSNRKRLGGALKYFFVLLTLVFSLFAGFSSAQAATHTVRFVYDCEGTRHECAVMTRETGAPFAFLPQNPFCAGKNFNHWVNDANDAVVDESTTVNGDMVVRAVYDDIHLYNITVNYYYIDCSDGNAKKVFDQAAYIIDGTKVTDGHPYQITSPAQTNVPVAVQNCTANATDDIFYPEEPTISITSAELAALGSGRELTREVKYVPFTATYSFVYKLKNLTGNGYTEIDRENNVHGVKNSTVTATVKNFDYAEFESTTPTLITEASGQEIDVLYTRKNFLLSFNTNGGTPVNAIQSPYGSEVTIPTSDPTRTGYTFAGWYLDEGLTQPAGEKVTLNADQTLYAKWTGNIVNYTIVYMKEKYNNQTGTSDWVYDNSKTGSGKVGDKVYAYSAPDLTNNIEGYEKDTEWNATSSITIAADGSAVLTVRYRLIRYTIVFNINRNNGRIKIDGREYKNSEYVVNNVVLGMDVSHVWPSSSNEIYSNNSYFAGWNDEHSWNQVTKVRTITYEYFENANDQNVVTWKAIWENRGNKNNVEYWFQQPNGEYQVDPYYTEVGINVSNTGLGHKEFDGYTFYNGTPNGYQGNANNQTVTVEVTEYDFADTYTDGGGHQVAVPENTTLERNEHTYTFSLSSAQTQTRSTSGHASANPNLDEQEIVVGGVTYAFVGSQAEEHCIEVDGSIKRYGTYQGCKDPEPEITRNGHTYLFKETTYSTSSWTGRTNGCTHHYCYTDYTYNYAYTTYTYTWVCREGAHTVQYSNRGYTYRFYYDRIKYNIDYYYGTEKLTTKEVKFGANINTAAYNYTPTKPANMDVDYTWGGWKSDANLTTDYTFDVMPGNDLILYACWNAPKYTVTFNLNYEGASEPYYSQTVEKYKVATDPGLPSRAHYMFEGWYTDPVGGARYSVGEQVTSDVTLYAHWQLIPLEYTVKYLEEGTNNELFTEKTVKSPAFTLGYEVTEQALTIAGYMPDNAEKRLALDYEGNVITFFYVTKPESNKYKVRYLLKDSNIEVHEESDWVTVPGNTTSITVLAANVDKTWMGGQPGVTQDILAKDYYPEEAATTFQLGKDGESNIFTIYYLDYKSVIFNITYVDMCGNPIPGIPVVKKAVQKNAMYELDRNLQGYTFNKLCASWAGLPEPQCSTYVSSTPVVWEAPDGPSSLEAWAYFQKNLTITAKNQNKTYDGTALRSEGTDDVTLLGLETGHALSSISFDGSVTNVSEGSVPTTPRDAQFTGACDSFYHIEYVPGNLRITPQEVTVALNPDRWTNGDCYNGVPRTIGFRNNGAEIIISSALYDSQHGDEIRTQAAAISMTKTDAGTYILPEADVLNGVRIPEDQNYNVTPVVRDGELVICPAPLTVTTGSATKAYDGEPLTKSDGATFSGLVGDEIATLVVTGTQTNVGESDNTYTINWGTAKESNYTITETLGTLKVNLSCTDTTLQTAADATDCTAEYTLVAPNTLDEGLSYFYKINDGSFTEFTEGLSSSFSDGDSIVWQARNNGSVFSTCTQTVRVEDGTKPVIDNIPDQNAIAAGGCQYKIPNLKELVLAQTTDNCQVDESYFVQLPDSNSMYEQGLDERTIPIEVKVRDMEGNEQTATVNVIIPANDLTLTMPEDNAICSGESVGLSATSNATVYAWSPSSGLNITDDATVMASPTATITYTLTVTGANGCGTSGEVTVMVNPLPTFTTTLEDVKCKGRSDGSIKVTTIVGTSPYQYSKDGGASYQTSDMFSNLTADSYSIKVKDAKGCESSVSSVTIAEPEALTVTITPPSEGCPGEQYNFTTEVIGGTGTPTYVWSGDAEGTAFSATITTDATIDSKTYIATVTVTDANGCAASDTKTLTIKDEAKPVCPANTSIVRTDVCVLSAAAITSEITGIVSGYATPLDNCTSNANLTVSVSNAVELKANGSQTYSYIISDACGNLSETCSQTIEIAVGNFTIPTVTSSGTVRCLADVKAPHEAGSGITMPEVKDALGNELTYTGPVKQGNPACEGDVTYTYTYTDCMGEHTHSWVYTYTIDMPAFELAENTGSATVNCPADAKAAGEEGSLINLPVVTDVCGNTITPTLKSRPDAVSCEGPMVYVYTYKDCAENEADYTFTYTVQAPVLTFSGTISDVENINDCYSATLVSYLLTDEQVKSMYSSNCDKTITVSHLDDTESDNNCGWKIIRTFTISDGCNEETKTQSVSGSDQTEPTISGTLAEKTVEGCSADLTTLYPAATTVAELEALGLSVSDNCTDDADMIVEYDEENEGTCPIVVTRTYTIKDACGNPTTVSQTIKVDDTTKPSISDELITSSPADVENCVFTVPDFESAVRSAASDNCTNNADLRITQNPEAATVINVTTDVKVTVEDLCGNSSTTTITVTVPEKLKGTITSAESFCYNTSDGVIEGTIEGGSAPYTVSWTGAAIGSQPDVMDMDIKIDSLPDGDYIVTVTDVNGCHDELNASIAQLTQTITLKADSKEKVYDGGELTLQNYTGADNLEPGDVIDDVVFSDDSKITNVGEVANTITSFRIMRGDKDVTCYYDTTMVPGLLKVTKRQVTLTSLDSTKFYDGTKLIRHEVVVSGDGFAAGEGATYDVTGSQTLVGTSENIFTYTLNDGTLADNYDITVVKGTLEVKANVTNIAIASASESWMYDCGTHKHEVYTVTYGTEEVAADESGKTFTLPTGDKLTVTPTTEGVKYVSDTEERNNTFTYTLENDNQYAGDRDTTYGTLSITQRPIVITAKDSTKIYDAIALTRNEFFTNGNEAECDNVVSVVIEGSQLNVGQSVNKISGAVIKSGDEDVTANYNITYVYGTLEVTPLDVIVTITGHTKTVIYNGTEQTVYGYEWIASDSLYNTADYFTYAGDSVAKGTTVGTYPMGLEAGQFNNTNNNFNVTFDVKDGWLTINRLDVIVDITGHVDTRTYNGVAQYVYGYDWKANTGLYTESDFRHVNDSVATGTTIGTYLMGLEVGQFTNVNENFTVVFNLVSDGRLTINKITTPITITAFSSTMVYDGGELTDDEFRYTRNVLVDGDVLFADVEGSIMDVGSVPNVVTGYRVLRDGEDVTENYTFNPSVDGTLTVTKRPVTFTSATDEKTYDGTPLTNSTVTVTPTATGKGFVQGEGAKFIVTGTITEIGTVDNTFTFEPYSNTDTANYDITVVFGKLTINKIVTPIVITANSNSKMYDGTPLTDDGFTFTTDVVAEGDALIADVEGTITDFGTVANKVTGYRVVRGADDVTKNYTFGESVDGTLSITKRHVTLTSASDSKVYDRRPLTNSEVTVGGDGFAENEGATYNVKGTIIDFGKVANAFDYALKTNTKAINYDIDTVYGTLSITKRPTAIVYNYGYDVKPDTVSGFADEPYAKMSDPVRTGYDFKGWDAQLPALLPLDTLTVTAQWSLVTYEIQLDTFETITYTVEDHKVIDLNDYIPYYEGHDFMGWRNNNGEIVTSISTDDAGSVQLTATWHIATYYITYISNGKTLKTVPIVFADPIPAIEDPVREGYLFKGWSPAIPATMPEGGVTVTAQWGLITYQLTLEDEGKVVGVYEYTVEDEFFYIDKIEDREGMRFDGWMLNGAMLDYDRNEGKYVFFPSLFADNVSITAKWTMISDEFNLVYKVDGVTYLTYVISAGESTASYVASVQDPADKRGYKFNGWDMDVPETMPRKSLTVNAVWKPITYAITLRDTSGEEIERIYYTIEETVQLPTYPDRDGQIFLGWSDGVNTYYEIKPGSSAEDFELTASWGVKSFEIIYIVDGIEYARDTIQAGAPLVKISDPETAEEGYAFSGWSTTPDIMPAHDLTVTGSFEKGGYTLTYVIDGETIKSVRYLYGAAISPTKAPNRPGYAFDIWEGLPATMPARDLTVNGKYKVATYSIVLRNEGVALDTIYYTIFDDAIALPVIEGPGKMFKGWYDGRKTVNRIKPSDYSGNIDLVASWIYFNYTVTFYVDDVQYSKNNSMRYGDVIQLPEEPTKEGLYFAGWKNMPADGLMPENDLKLYAIFSTEPVINVGTDDFEEVPTVDVYTEVGEIVVLRAENMDIQVLDFDGVTLFIGKSNAEKFSIPVRYRGAYIVRINNQFRKVLVK